MIKTKKSSLEPGYIDEMDRSFRAGIGMIILCASLYITNQTGEAYPVINLISATIVLTGIAGWDPFVACYRALKELLVHKKADHKALFTPS